MIVNALQNKSTEFDSLNSDSSCPEIATAIENSNLEGKAIYLGEFINEWTNSYTFTASKNIPENYIIVLSDIRIRVNGVDAVQKFKFNAERVSSSTFNVYVSDYNVSAAERYGAYSFKAYAISIN